MKKIILSAVACLAAANIAHADTLTIDEFYKLISSQRVPGIKSAMSTEARKIIMKLFGDGLPCDICCFLDGGSYINYKIQNYDGNNALLQIKFTGFFGEDNVCATLRIKGVDDKVVKPIFDNAMENYELKQGLKKQLQKLQEQQ